MIEIRQCNLADMPYIYDICWKTAYRGRSVEDIFTDKFKTGHYFAAPYLYHDPECCFAAADNGRPLGYIVGTSDTAGYTEWLNSKWLPKVRECCNTAHDEKLHPIEQYLNKCIRNDTVLDKSLAEYPAHLHIDLLPELRGGGYGRRLMEIFFRQCATKGAGKVHLAVARANENALAFYRKMGMYTITENDAVCTLGKDLP